MLHNLAIPDLRLSSEGNRGQPEWARWSPNQDSEALHKFTKHDATHSAQKGVGASMPQEAVRHPSLVSLAWELRSGGIGLHTHAGSLAMLGLTCGAGIMILLLSAPVKEGKAWDSKQWMWHATSVVQILVISGTSAFVLIEFPFRARRCGLQLWEMGLVLGAQPFGHLVVLPLSSWLSRRFSSAAISGAAAFARSALLLAFAQHDSVVALVIFRTLLGASCGLAHSAVLAFLTAHWREPRELRDILAREEALVSFGALLGCAVGGFLFTFSYVMPFWFAAVANVSAGAIALWVLRSPGDCGALFDVGEISDCVPQWKRSEHAEEADEVSAAGSSLQRGHSSKAAKIPHTKKSTLEESAIIQLLAWPSLCVAGSSVSVAAAVVGSWDLLLSQHLRAGFPKVFPTPLELGVAWAVFHAWQLLVGLAARRGANALRDCGHSQVEVMRSLWGGPWLLAGAGWLLISGGFLILAMYDACFLGFVAGMALLAAGVAVVWASSMPCLLAAVRPLGRATAQRLVPDLWLAAACLGEAFGPLAAAMALRDDVQFISTSDIVGDAGPRLRDIRNAAELGGAVALGFVLVLSLGFVGKAAMAQGKEWAGLQTSSLSVRSR